MKRLKVLSQEINWWWPLLYGLIGIGLTGIVTWLDVYVSDWFPKEWQTTLGLAQTIHSSVFTGLLAMMTFTFSTILVVLTTYSSQFSPRTLPNFIENRQVQHIFGIFIGAVSYSMTMLFFLRPALKTSVVASAVAVLVVLLSIVAFVAFIHIVSQSIRVTTLLDRLHEEGNELLKRQIDHIETGEHVILVEQSKPTYPIPIQASCTGYVQAIDYEGISNEEVVYISTCIGSFVTEGQVVGWSTGKGMGKYMLIGPTKSSEQDFSFVIEKLSEVALRAISPGINDPNTARQAIRIIGDLMRCYAVLPDGALLSGEHHRHITERITFQELLYKTFYQLRHYGEEDVSVLATMLESLGTMKRQALPAHYETIQRFIPYICSEVRFEKMNDWDRDFLQKQIDRVLNETFVSSST
ncbi:DUF2254 domain-containing protein [Exiguobacterium sp. s168]|uniref:DUF2254 domain-containing protein n=1 Tax=Exiguobacterium sp. s168 TaxID=2751194 RepID=UPI001BEA628C|nr:DUF2254 domain-containing protein [Exiguobacterium sp. s168]